MTQKATLGEYDQRRLATAAQGHQHALSLIDDFRQVVVEMIDKSSYREVARLTGLSTNTLQRWKREAGR